MPHYCDSKVLERNWFSWLIGEPTPSLDRYRRSGLLLTKVISKVPPASAGAGQKPPDPFWGDAAMPRRSHCLAAASPVYFSSAAGRCGKPYAFSGSRPVPCQLPDAAAPPDPASVGRLLAAGFVLERPIGSSWDAILLDVQKICHGISLKFNLQSEEAHEELASEAFVHAINKIKNRKLVYTPGRAPVFNLLTTTIHRIMYSLLNKRTKERENRAEHARIVMPMAAIRGRGRVITRRVFGSQVAMVSR